MPRISISRVEFTICFFRQEEIAAYPLTTSSQFNLDPTSTSRLRNGMDILSNLQQASRRAMPRDTHLFAIRLHRRSLPQYKQISKRALFPLLRATSLSRFTMACGGIVVPLPLPTSITLVEHKPPCSFPCRHLKSLHPATPDQGCAGNHLSGRR